eukprot:sb/3461912/
MMRHFGTDSHKDECGWKLTEEGGKFILKKFSNNDFTQTAIGFSTGPPERAEVNSASPRSKPSPLLVQVDQPSTPSTRSSEAQTVQHSFGDMETQCDMDPTAKELAEVYREFPVLGHFTHNAVKRKRDYVKSSTGQQKGPHDPKLKDLVASAGLQYSVRSAAYWSTMLGGPQVRTVEREVQDRLQVQPFLNKKHLKDHCLNFKKIMAQRYGFDNNAIARVPVIAAMDATAVCTRLGTKDDKAAVMKADKDSYRLLYGIETGGPFKEVRISPEHIPGEPSIFKVKGGKVINGLQECGKALKNGKVLRAGKYIAILLMPLVKEPFPYCIGIFPENKGFNADDMRMVQNEVRRIAVDVGLCLFACPGDGDTVLRKVQWTFYTEKRLFSWLGDLPIPVEVFFNFIENFQIAMQDCAHDIKKMRNQPAYLRTKCLAFGLDRDRAKETVIRWNFVLDVVKKLDRLEEPHNMSLSGLLITDRQDPSIVADICCHYQVFVNNGYYALGLYMKAIQFLTEAFYDRSLWPEERIWKASWVKTFFVKWSELVCDENFITKETFHDVKCSVDGLILYIMVLRKNFPEQDVVPWFLTSDVCEQAFAFVRTGRYSGRRTNVDCITLAEGLECLNKRSEISSEYLPSGSHHVAHCRGRAILKQPYGIPWVRNKDLDVKGGDTTHGSVAKAIEAGMNSCVAECVKYRLLAAAPGQARYKSANNDEDEDDISDYSTDEEGNHEDIEHEEDTSSSKVMVKTNMGKLHIKTAERIYLNERGFQSSAKGRSGRIKGKKHIFSDNSIINYHNKQACCPDLSLRVGQYGRFPKFVQKKKGEKAKVVAPVKVTGEIVFISTSLSPLKVACTKHHNDITLWVWSTAREMYFRCLPPRSADVGREPSRKRARV